MADPSAPDVDGGLLRKVRSLEKQVAELKRPSGTQRFGSVEWINRTLSYLASLTSTGMGSGGTLSTGTVAADDVFHWYANSPQTIISALPIATGKCVVSGSVGEASITPGGSFVIGAISFSLRDANDVAVPGGALGTTTARYYTSQRVGVPLRFEHSLTIDPVLYPGPYTIRLFFGMWVASANTTACSTVFQNPNLRVDVIGDGVPA